MTRIRSLIASGLGLAALAQFLALMLSGSGEGWNTPMRLSLALWVLFPITLVATQRDSGNKATLMIVALLALIGDVLLVRGTLDERSYLLEYVRVNGLLGVLFVGFWLILWFSWQFLAIRAFIASPGSASGADA